MDPPSITSRHQQNKLFEQMDASSSELKTECVFLELWTSAELSLNAILSGGHLFTSAPLTQKIKDERSHF